MGVAGVGAALDAPRRRHPVDERTAAVRRRVRNFERVINAYYPTVTDSRLTSLAPRRAPRGERAGATALKWYGAPYELRALQRLMHYQRPETTGF